MFGDFYEVLFVILEWQELDSGYGFAFWAVVVFRIVINLRSLQTFLIVMLWMWLEFFVFWVPLYSNLNLSVEVFV